jgi:peroxiredoxin
VSYAVEGGRHGAPHAFPAPLEHPSCERPGELGVLRLIHTDDGQHGEAAGATPSGDVLRRLWPRNPRLAALLEVGLLVFVWVLVGAYQTRRHVSARSGTAPAFTLTSLDGRSVSLADFRGKKVVLHFFATWCGVCKAELPSVRGVQSGLDDDEVLLAIAEDSDDVDALRRFAREHDLRYPILLGRRDVLAAYAVGAFPTNYYLNADGTVSSSTTGLSTRVGMELRLFLADGR